jgi:hypothetical protein
MDEIGIIRNEIYDFLTDLNLDVTTGYQSEGLPYLRVVTSGYWLWFYFRASEIKFHVSFDNNAAGFGEVRTTFDGTDKKDEDFEFANPAFPDNLYKSVRKCLGI